MKPISEVALSLKRNEILPVYFLCGEDTYSVSQTAKQISKKVEKLVASDFDMKSFYGGESNIQDILDFACEYPFGSEKKLGVVKDFDKLKFLKEADKSFTAYLKNPGDFTVLILLHDEPDPGRSKDSSIKLKEFFKFIDSKGWAFEAKELRGAALNSWVKSEFALHNKTITPENAQLLIDIVGEDRYQINQQIEKLLTSLAEKKEVSAELVKDQATSMKEYSIFDLQSAIASRKKGDIITISSKIMEQGEEALGLIGFFTKYFLGLMQIPELLRNSVSDEEAARVLGTNKYYYKNYIDARKHYSDNDLYRISNALFHADYAVKTSAFDGSIVIMMLMAEITGESK